MGVDMGELPEPWNTAAEQAGVRQTYRGIGDRAGLSHVTVRRLITEGRTSPTTIGKVAEALHVDESTIYDWAGIERSEWGPWTPPREAYRLNPRARAAIDELIRAVTQGGSDAGPAEAEKRPDDPAGGGAAVIDLRATQPDDPAHLARAAGHGRKGRAAFDAQLGADGEENQDPEGE